MNVSFIQSRSQTIHAGGFPGARRHILLLAFLLLTIGWVVLADGAQAKPANHDQDVSTSFVIGPWRVLEDPSGTLDWREALSQPPERWSELTGSALSPGQSHSAWWVRTTIDNRGSVDQRRILEVGWPLLDWLDVWIVRDGAVLERLNLGDRRPFDSRPLDTRTFAVPLEIPAGERREILLRLEMKNALFAPVVFQLWLPDEFWSHIQRENLWAGVYFGALLALFAYNLLLFLTTRDRNFLLYALYLGLLTLWAIGFLGYGFQMFWPDDVWWQNHAYLARAVVANLASAFFVMSFLETRRRMPVIHGVLSILTLLVFATLLVEVIGWFGVATPMAEALRAYVSLSSVLFTIYLVAGARAVWLGVHEARYFLLAWFFPVMGMVVFAVQDLADLVRQTPLADHSFEIGTLLECLLLALALGDRYQRLRDEKAALEGHLQLERDAREEQRAFLAIVSHELRTPLAVIDLTMQNLARGAARTADERTRRRYHRVLEASRQLAGLLSIQLDADRHALDGHPLRREPCEPAALLREAAAVGRLTGRGHPVRIEPTATDSIVCDPDLTRLALRSLVDNAVKYTPPGTEVILRSGRHADRFWFEVHDTGPGLSEEALAQIFEPHVRGQGSGAVRGSGMGLTLARRLIEHQGGTLTAGSAPGEGCVFRIELPVLHSDTMNLSPKTVPVPMQGLER